MQGLLSGITETLKKSLPKDMQIHKSTATSLNLITNLNFIFSFSELEEYFQRFFRNMSMAFESVVSTQKKTFWRT